MNYLLNYYKECVSWGFAAGCTQDHDETVWNSVQRSVRHLDRKQNILNVMFANKHHRYTRPFHYMYNIILITLWQSCISFSFTHFSDSSLIFIQNWFKSIFPEVNEYVTDHSRIYRLSVERQHSTQLLYHCDIMESAFCIFMHILRKWKVEQHFDETV